MNDSILTKEEELWIRKVQKLLNNCPPRLGFYTIGDPDIGIFDRTKEHLFDDRIDMVHEIDKYEAGMGRLNFPSSVHGVCG